MQTHKQLAARYHNSLHGFQPLSNGTELCIGFIPEHFNTPENIQSLKEATGSETLESDDFIGRYYLSIAVSEKHLIPEVVWQVNGMGVGVKLQTKTQPYYPEHCRLRVSVENSEKILVETFQKYGTNEYKALDMFDCCHGRWVVHEPELWKTAEGKALARRFRERETDNSFKFWTWPSFQNEPSFPDLDYPISQNITTQTPQNTQEIQETQEEIVPEPVVESSESINCERIIEECMICLDKPPSTMVLPCMHAVVCGDCSRQLKNTNDRATLC